MSEIKFACPHCAQHIACDRDYADMCIVCPTCGQPLEVPRLSAAEPSHPDLCVMASIPRPKQRFTSRIPTIDLWKENEWEERYRATATPSQQTPVWLLSAMGTVIAAALLKATMMPAWAVILCILAGTGLSCYFVAKGQIVPLAPAAHSGAGAVGSAIVRIFLVLLAIPVVALGVLFIGCAACH